MKDFLELIGSERPNLSDPPVPQKFVNPCENDKTFKHPEPKTAGEEKGIADLFKVPPAPPSYTLCFGRGRGVNKSKGYIKNYFTAFIKPWFK